MRPVVGSLCKFKVFESSDKVIVGATDKFEEEFHILHFYKCNDNEKLKYGLASIIEEDVATYNKTEYIEELQKSGRERQNNIFTFAQATN